MQDRDDDVMDNEMEKSLELKTSRIPRITPSRTVESTALAAIESNASTSIKTNNEAKESESSNYSSKVKTLFVFCFFLLTFLFIRLYFSSTNGFISFVISESTTKNNKQKQY